MICYNGGGGKGWEEDWEYVLGRVSNYFKNYKILQYAVYGLFLLQQNMLESDWCTVALGWIPSLILKYSIFKETMSVLYFACWDLQRIVAILSTSDAKWNTANKTLF